MVTFQIPKTDFHTWISSEFPNLSRDHYRLTSPISDEYNCIAWAAEDTEKWWWPSEDGFWPDSLPLVDALANFIQAFQLQGYLPCDNGELEAGYEKVVLYQSCRWSDKAHGEAASERPLEQQARESMGHRTPQPRGVGL
jgi:hypothetical protein